MLAKRCKILPGIGKIIDREIITYILNIFSRFFNRFIRDVALRDSKYRFDNFIRCPLSRECQATE